MTTRIVTHAVGGVQYDEVHILGPGSPSIDGLEIVCICVVPDAIQADDPIRAGGGERAAGLALDERDRRVALVTRAPITDQLEVVMVTLIGTA
jgi:hypothetical protein